MSQKDKSRVKLKRPNSNTDLESPNVDPTLKQLHKVIKETDQAVSRFSSQPSTSGSEKSNKYPNYPAIYHSSTHSNKAPVTSQKVMGLLIDCQDLFNTEDLYEIVGSTKSATVKDLKRAYYKASLKFHPDRADIDKKDEATVKFQVLGKVYAILSDKEKRAIYDETGEIDDENVPKIDDWYQYWRQHFPRITEEDIKQFETKYKGSKEELVDLKQAYERSKGDMGAILESVPCSSIDDEERFQEIICEWIKKGEVEDYKFAKRTKSGKARRKRQAEAEALEAEEMRKEMGIDGSEDSLRRLILNRAQDRSKQMDSFFDQLATKYGGSESKKKRGKK